MKTKYTRVTLKQAQTHLGEICNAATSKRDIIIITQPAGSDVALLAAGELAALVETLYLLGSPKNAARLLAALRLAQRDVRSSSKFRRNIGPTSADEEGA